MSMQVGISFDLDRGDYAVLMKRLRSMTLVEQGNMFAAALRTVASPFVRAVKRQTPVGPTGNLKRSISHDIKKYRGGQLVYAYIGPSWWNRGRHGHLVEYGTKRRINKRGQNRGIMPMNPFLTPTFLANKSGLETALAASVAANVEKIWGK